MSKKHFRDIISKQRDGYEVEDWEIVDFVHGVASGEASDAQVAAYTMAVHLRGMTGGEMVILTKAMRDSGKVINWSELNLDAPVVDKHSTGGVGDLTSLILTPILASCGAYVPMLSGRGIGHVGGTLDKLESIDGYKTSLSVSDFQKVVKDIGCAIVGHSDEMNPANRRIFAARDQVGTVNSEALIVSSIVSKKLAAGIKNLVLDVKAGSGAFMRTYSSAKKLATKLVGVSNSCGIEVSAVVTDMNQPLGYSAGNAVELREAVEYLTNKKRNGRVHEVVMKLGAESLMQADLASDIMKAESNLNFALDSGEAAEKFDKMVAALGGPKDFIDNYEKHLPKAEVVKPVFAKKRGFIHTINTREYGNALIKLGGAREFIDEKINHAVGISDIAPISAEVDQDKPIATVHANSESDFEKVSEMIIDAVSVESIPISAGQPVLDTIKPAKY